MFNVRSRFVWIYIIVSISFICLICRMLQLQLAEGESYRNILAQRSSVTIREKVPRGNILDRYGRILATDRQSYTIAVKKQGVTDVDFSRSVLKVFEILRESGEEFNDAVTVDKIINGEASDTFTVVNNASAATVSKITELKDSLPGVEIMQTYERVYCNDSIASHIIGRTGRINEDEYNRLKKEGYGYNDIIGKQGAEKLAEAYLRGKDGVFRESSSTETVSLSQPGNNVVLSIDIEMQRVLETSLEKTIKQISEKGGYKNGEDADSGAAVVIDVHTGDILACASYPTYDISDFGDKYGELASDESLPLWNRAVSGTYSPGSTFKPLVAIAALGNGKITPDEKIKDEGIYTAYDDYRPRCWIWSENRTTHGELNITEAIANSCNYYFYEAGRRTGIDEISSYAEQFGLGKKTGTGLPEEVEGMVANPQNKKKITDSINEQGWYGADTLQASIGQSVNMFTPIQLANYIATLANGGTRYKLNLIKSVHSSVDGSRIYEAKPEAAEKVEIRKCDLQAVLQGMRNVAEEGSAKGIFAGYPVPVGGKTGTAQVGSKVSNNALFTAFAPFDEPEIAVCVVIEHGVRGVNAAYVAKDLFDYYFNLRGEAVSAFNVTTGFELENKE